MPMTTNGPPKWIRERDPKEPIEWEILPSKSKNSYELSVLCGNSSGKVKAQALHSSPVEQYEELWSICALCDRRDRQGNPGNGTDLAMPLAEEHLPPCGFVQPKVIGLRTKRNSPGLRKVATELPK